MYIQPSTPGFFHGTSFSPQAITVLLLTLGLFLAPALSASRALAEEAPVYIDVSATEVSKVKIAVPPFVDLKTGAAVPAGHEMAVLLGRGFEFHGFIEVVEAPGREVDWGAMGVDYYVEGDYQVTNQVMSIEAKLFDVSGDKMLFGRRYQGAPAKRDDMVLRFCDTAIEEFSGTPGVSRTSIAFTADTSGRKEVYVADVLGRHIRQVTKHKTLAVSPRFSPDGHQLAYSSYHAGNQNLYVTDLRQDKVTRAVSRHKGMNMAPAWSPDGTRMVVTLSQDGSPDLYVINLQGQIEQRLTSGSGINVSANWSPDGKTLAFVSDRTGTPQVYVMDMGSKKTRRLTFQGRENTEPSWSPSGDKIAYTSMVNGRYQVFVMDASGAGARQVSKAPGQHESPSWSPDGRQLVVTSKLGREEKISAVLINGDGYSRPLFDLKGRHGSPQWSSREE